MNLGAVFVIIGLLGLAWFTMPWGILILLGLGWLYKLG